MTHQQLFLLPLDEFHIAIGEAYTAAISLRIQAYQFQIDAAPGAEAKCVFTIHPRGNQYGWSNN